MHQNNASGGTKSSAPNNQPTAKSSKGNAHVPQSRSDWSLVLSALPDNWVLTPVQDKRPLRPDWQHETEIARCDLLDLLDKGQKLKTSLGKIWHCHWTGIGLRLGTVSGGLMAIDADGELAEAKLQELSNGELPLTPCWTSGKDGRRQLLYQIPSEYWDKVKTVKIDCGEGQYLEFRWDGCQSVLPPSKHPETGQYYWLTSPQETETAIAPDWIIKFIESKAQHRPEGEVKIQNSKSPPISPPSQWTDIDWARSYLNALSSYRADDYDQWLQVGMALHSVSDSLLTDWDDWSRQSSKYQPGICERKWRSFQPTKGLGIGALAHWAKEDGWKSPPRGSQKVNMKNTQENLKQAITRLILEGIQGSDRQLAIFKLSCDYSVSSQQLERYWQQLEQELEAEQIKPELINQVKNHLHNRHYHLDASKIFPESFARLLTTCANEFPGPVEGLVLPLLGTTAGCVGIGAEVVIKQASGYKQPCLIRTLLLAETGEMKSPLMNIITAPLIQLEKDAFKLYKQELKEYEAAIAGGDQSVQRPVRERFALMDCTPEKMVKIHAESPKGFTFIHDEWGGYVNGFNKYRNGVGNDREMDLTEFNGGAYIRDRVNDESLFIEKMAVSRIGGYQLSLMYNLMEKQDDQDGFLNRWLMAAPPFPPAYKNIIDDSKDHGKELQQVLLNLYASLRRLPTAQYHLSFEAKQHFQTWQHYLVDLTLDETQISLRGFYPKLEAYTARLALLLHLINAVVEGHHPSDMISGATMEKAVYLAQYFLTQAQWIYCRKNSHADGLSGMLAQIQEFCFKKGGVISARQIKMAISSIKKCSKASTNFIREQFKQLAEMGRGILEGCGIRLRYRAVSTNQQNESLPPPIPVRTRDSVPQQNVDTPYQHFSTSTKSDIFKVPMRVSIDGATLRGMGWFAESGEIQVELSSGMILTVPLEAVDYVSGDENVDVDKNVDTPINTLEFSQDEASQENVDVDKNVDTPINTLEFSQDKASQENVDLLIPSPNEGETETGRQKDWETGGMNLNNNHGSLTSQSPRENLPSSIDWDSFPMHNCRSPQEIALELKELLLQCYQEGRILEAVQSFTYEAISWVIRHLMNPSQQTWFENVIQSS